MTACSRGSLWRGRGTSFIRTLWRDLPAAGQRQAPEDRNLLGKNDHGRDICQWPRRRQAGSPCGPKDAAHRRSSSRRLAPQDEVQRHERYSAQGRENHRGNRVGRRSDRFESASLHPRSRLAGLRFLSSRDKETPAAPSRAARRSHREVLWRRQPAMRRPRDEARPCRDRRDTAR